MNKDMKKESASAVGTDATDRNAVLQHTPPTYEQIQGQLKAQAHAQNYQPVNMHGQPAAQILTQQAIPAPVQQDYSGQYGAAAQMGESNPVYANSKKERLYTKQQSIAAVIAFIVGYMYVHLSLSMNGGFASTLFFIVLSVFSLIFLRSNGIKVTKTQYAALGLLALFSLHFTLFDTTFVSTLNHLFVGVGFMYWLYCVSGARASDIMDSSIILDMFRAVFEAPFLCFSRIFGAVRSGARKSKAGKAIVFSAIGIIIAVPLTAIIVSLLYSADTSFANMINIIFENILSHIFVFIFQLGLAIPFAMYFYGGMFRSCEISERKLLGDYKRPEKVSVSKKLPSLTIYFTITPIIAAYVLFFSVQTKNLFSAFAGVKPYHISLAEYARSGFFELCAVAVINAVLIFIVEVFQKRKDGKKTVVQRIYICTMSLLTILIVATALSKMALYIERYGLTRARVFSSWFMVLLGLLFVLEIVRQFADKINYTKCAVIISCAMFALLVFGNTDRLIANVNIEMYLSGQHEKLDVELIDELNCAAVDEVIRACNTIDTSKDMDKHREVLCLKIYLCEQSYRLGVINFDEYEEHRSNWENKLRNTDCYFASDFDSYLFDPYYEDFIFDGKADDIREKSVERIHAAALLNECFTKSDALK